ncbi:helix-turn-helix transcriptional regulator [Mobiluncus mulieris]|uniref:Helix-turn-helix domain-containing protein n=1 Tax=Mobiluncus mulieris TaxID=2052 RepID=A0A378PJ86_9ACTO|nr:helix-turn-helix domain-containing protein [Mobiluncus mulieris]MCU9969448.1 helix-turn-helix domain-containing protein [Mobiluncus mulieris]MCU9970132.1 helix-turn-helix domain-containing protein [Mobiluncus mulieris]MCU9973887.1 helix-turn-helix domain-containing protein [Mobiluncus mulieris]MCU9993618.1 helix-turn-helix domain-containing protein [Mobiluncus mulieris]MCV0009233.1 helix-turn-helix domain-containing protein [Mobiluncus mulieris]
MITESVADEDLQRRVEVTCVDLLPHEVLTLNELSEFIQVPPQTIKRWRSEGYGPRAALMKKELRYVREDVIAWLRYEAEKDERCSRDAYEPRIKTLR